jgi:hypothetical protein
LPLQHLGDQVLGDRPVAAGELGHETLGIRVPASEISASHSPAAQPSVRWWSVPATSSGSAIPAAATSCRVSSSVKRSCAARISANSPASRSRCRRSGGSRRVATIARVGGGDASAAT